MRLSVLCSCLRFLLTKSDNTQGYFQPSLLIQERYHGLLTKTGLVVHSIDKYEAVSPSFLCNLQQEAGDGLEQERQEMGLEQEAGDGLEQERQEMGLEQERQEMRLEKEARR